MVRFDDACLMVSRVAESENAPTSRASVDVEKGGLLADGIDYDFAGHDSRRRDRHFAARPSPFSRRLNRHGVGVPSK